MDSGSQEEEGSTANGEQDNEQDTHTNNNQQESSSSSSTPPTTTSRGTDEMVRLLRDSNGRNETLILKNLVRQRHWEIRTRAVEKTRREHARKILEAAQIMVQDILANQKQEQQRLTEAAQARREASQSEDEAIQWSHKALALQRQVHVWEQKLVLDAVGMPATEAEEIRGLMTFAASKLRRWHQTAASWRGAAQRQEELAASLEQSSHEILHVNALTAHYHYLAAYRQSETILDYILQTVDYHSQAKLIKELIKLDIQDARQLVQRAIPQWLLNEKGIDLVKQQNTPIPNGPLPLQYDQQQQQ